MRMTTFSNIYTIEMTWINQVVISSDVIDTLLDHMAKQFMIMHGQAYVQSRSYSCEAIHNGIAIA